MKLRTAELGTRVALRISEKKTFNGLWKHKLFRSKGLKKKIVLEEAKELEKVRV